MSENLQYYPTPPILAARMWGAFKNKEHVRVLEPSAGTGSLLDWWMGQGYHRRADRFDCIEVDLERQAILRGKGYRVVDSDFMNFTGAGMYSHIIMNPPFNDGVDHVLKAWDLLVDGEIVALLGASALKNPHTKKREHLLALVEKHGSVEYIEDAFLDPEAKVKTAVEVALVHLEKRIDLRTQFTKGLEVDPGQGVHYAGHQDLALRESVIPNVVKVFNSAVDALRTSVIAQAEAGYYQSMLGKALNQEKEDSGALSTKGVIEKFNEGYDDLKKRAWTNVLHSTDFQQHLSSKAYQKLVSDFEKVSQLSFTESNIRGFLLGLVQGKGDMNLQMVLDCFDEISKYHPENRAFYRGWKSNDKHRTQAYRIKMTRFILPIRSGYGQSADWDHVRLLRDFDKVFAMLDGKQNCVCGLGDVFNNPPAGLRDNKRIATDYFEVRWYPKSGSAHFFPTDKKLIDRMNRLVGKHRQWLPPQDEQVTGEFWKQYSDAEKITDAMQVKAPRWGYPEDKHYVEAHDEACAKLGYDLSSLLLEHTVEEAA